MQGYGLTETSPVTNLDFVEPDRVRPGSVGPPLADTEERVVDLETGLNDVPAGDVGELLVRGPQVTSGYYGNPEATAETITPDGWLSTGDIVRMDADGYVWILDRKKELIKYKGFQVPPAELEGLLLEHPAIADAAVIGKADVEAGEIPKAFVVRKSGVDVSGQDVMSFVAGKVSTFKHVREVEFVDAIPKNPSGKILRRILIEEERAKSNA
jgi:long-chain acyl-CoA synthetase